MQTYSRNRGLLEPGAGVGSLASSQPEMDPSR